MHVVPFVVLTVGFATAVVSQRAAAQSFASPVTVTASLGSKMLGSAVSMNMTGVGSGKNGPETAQFGTNMQCLKSNYVTTTTAGDLNCMNITLTQGAPNSDARAFVINEQNTGLGFSNGVEMADSTLDPSTYAVPYYVDVQLADVFAGGGMDGAVFNSVTGTGMAGILIDTQGMASWMNLLEGAKNGKTYFAITGGGSIVTSGKVVAAGIVASGSIHATSIVITRLTKSHVIEKANCGTTIRDLSSRPSKLIVPFGLPTGCQVSIIQAGAGAITFEGKDTQAEHMGTPDRWSVQTTGRSAEAELLIDSSKTFLLRGEVEAIRPIAPALVSDLHSFGDDEALNLNY